MRILATALLALSLTASGAFATSMDDLVLVDGLWHKKFTDVPFTGKVDEGTARGEFKNGKKEGPRVGYWDDGRLMFKGGFKNGEREGPSVTFWNNGQFSYFAVHENGNREGPSVQYHDNGQLFWKGEYKNNEQEGLWVTYYENGTKNEDYSGTYRNGVKVSY